MPPSTTDYYTKHGAGTLADMVNAYWAKRGVSHVLAERYPMGSTGAWGVRSNLVGGLPPPQKRAPRNADHAERKREFLK